MGELTVKRKKAMVKNEESRVSVRLGTEYTGLTSPLANEREGGCHDVIFLNMRFGLVVLQWRLLGVL
jgi:hypothetical protein